MTNPPVTSALPRKKNNTTAVPQLPEQLQLENELSVEQTGLELYQVGGVADWDEVETQSGWELRQNGQRAGNAMHPFL